MLTAHFHADQCGSQLLRLQFTAHDCREQLVALLLGQRLGLIQFFENRLQRVGLFKLLLCPGQRLLQQTRALSGEN
ncbi:hypothetical protein D3C73_1338720 [compost metagenome]